MDPQMGLFLSKSDSTQSAAVCGTYPIGLQIVPGLAFLLKQGRIKSPCDRMHELATTVPGSCNAIARTISLRLDRGPHFLFQNKNTLSDSIIRWKEFKEQIHSNRNVMRPMVLITK
ncbi:hypothetical protein X801_06103, partial [Opisthorchis viverrini]